MEYLQVRGLFSQADASLQFLAQLGFMGPLGYALLDWMEMPYYWQFYLKKTILSKVVPVYQKSDGHDDADKDATAHQNNQQSEQILA